MGIRIKNLRSFSRRGFLGTSVGLGALPWLTPARFAGAAPLASRRRLIVFFTPNGSLGPTFWKPELAEGATRAELTATALPDPISALNRHRESLFMVGGDIRLPCNGNHAGVSAVLTGYKPTQAGSQDMARAAGISIDQLLGQRMDETPLVLGVGGRLNSIRGQTRMSYLGAGQPVAPILSPLESFADVFGNGPSDNEVAALRRLAQRRSILDKNAEQLMLLRQRLSGEEGSNLDLHLDRVRDLELKLSDGSALPEACVGPEVPHGLLWNKAKNRMTTIRLHMDIMIESMRCGARNLGVLQCGDGGQMMTQPLFAPEYGLDLTVNEHDADHKFNPSKTGEILTNRVAIEYAYYSLFAELMDKLKAATDIDGLPLLDNTVVLWCKSLAQGHGSQKQFFMFGGGQNSGITKLGFYEDPGSHYANDIMISTLQLMGQSDQTFGDPDLVGGSIVV